MSTWTRILNLYIDTGAAGGPWPLLVGFSAQSAASLQMVQGDRFTLRIWFRTKSAAVGVQTVSAELEAGSGIIVAAKPAASLAAEGLLFSASGFVKQTESGATYYEGTLDLSTAALTAAFDSASSLAVAIDIEVQDANNEERMTFRVPATIHRQAYGGEVGAEAGLYPGSLVRQYTDADGEWVGIFAKNDTELIRWPV